MLILELVTNPHIYTFQSFFLYMGLNLLINMFLSGIISQLGNRYTSNGSSSLLTITVARRNLQRIAYIYIYIYYVFMFTVDILKHKQQYLNVFSSFKYLSILVL